MTLDFEHNGQAYYLTLLDNPGDVTRSQFIDFCKPIENWTEADMQRAKDDAQEIEQETADSPAEQGNEETLQKGYSAAPFRYFLAVAQQGGESLEMAEAAINALSVFVKGDLMQLPFHTEGDDLLKMLDSGVDLFEGELTVCRVLAFTLLQVVEMIEDLPAVGLNYEFEYRGETFLIDHLRAETMAEASTGRKKPKYNVATMMEISEWERIFAMKSDKDGDKDGALQFHLEMVIMALLCRKPGESLPMDRAEREAFIDERAQFFKELPLSIFTQVRFFLTRTFQDFAKNQAQKHILGMARNFRNSHPRGKQAGYRKQSSTGKQSQKLFTRT